MVDLSTYKKLHPDPIKLFQNTPANRVEMLPESLTKDTPPSEPDLLLFPSTINGYNLRRKK